MIKYFFTKKMYRKGFTYIIVTTLMVAILLSIFFASNRYKYQDQEALQQMRIRAMNDFVKNFNEDIHRATYISAFRTLLALEDYVTYRGIYLTNINESFRETFYNGTINGTVSVIMANSTFKDYVTKVSAISESTGMILNVNVTEITLSQTTPWAIDVHMFLNITLQDTKRTASWNISKEYVTVVPITNLRDPLYSKNTLNKVPNTIRMSPSPFLIDDTDVSNFDKHINGSYYIASSLAPNFIMRFEGKTDADPNGIESIVDNRILLNPELPSYPSRVRVDYIYFNAVTSADKICFNVSTQIYGNPVVLTPDREQLYGFENLTATACP
ncbi:MAG: hypothetical protein ACP5N1_00275 [Candidatus Woesearchaeota archaeon]